MHFRRFAIREQMSLEKKQYVKDFVAIRAICKMFYGDVGLAERKWGMLSGVYEIDEYA